MVIRYWINVLWGVLMITNSDMTLYHYDEAQKIYQRIYIYGVFWDSNKRSNTLKSGNAVTDSVFIAIPAQHVSSLKITVGKDLVVKGISTVAISNSSEQTQLSSYKALKESKEVFTVSVCDPKLFGSPAMQHYELSCK